ncbi:hypothetical protein AA21952_3210 [Acetobacter oeni LMG 21952]|nr:hypothetical protein AA21952_3210 [Acetobacter oeni LMG 21952]
MQGDQRLVGGHNRLSTGQRGFDKLPCRAFRPANKLHNNIHIRITDQTGNRVMPAKTAEIDPAITMPVPGRHGSDLNRPTGTGRYDVSIVTK